MILRGRRWIITNFVSVLQNYFKNHAVYKWETDILKTKLYIDESFPASERKYPSLILNVEGNGEFLKSSFGRQLQSEIKNSEEKVIGRRHGFFMNFNVSIEISAINKYQCEEITDEVCAYLLFDALNNLSQAGIILKDATPNPVSQQQYGKQNIHTITLNISVQTEWEKNFIPENPDIIEDVIGYPTIYDNSGKTLEDNEFYTINGPYTPPIEESV